MSSLQTHDVQHKLIDLYCSPYMSSSVKLQIIRALDHTTRLKDGLDWFVGRHQLQVETEALIKSEGNEPNPRPTCYQRLLRLMKEQQVWWYLKLTLSTLFLWMSCCMRYCVGLDLSYIWIDVADKGFLGADSIWRWLFISIGCYEYKTILWPSYLIMGIPMPGKLSLYWESGSYLWLWLQMARSMVALMALVRKVHLYEMLNGLAQTVEE